jgi:hypothetical protein
MKKCANAFFEFGHDVDSRLVLIPCVRLIVDERLVRRSLGTVVANNPNRAADRNSKRRRLAYGPNRTTPQRVACPVCAAPPATREDLDWQEQRIVSRRKLHMIII